MFSKNRMTFDNRMLHAMADVELIDIFSTMNKNGILAPENNSSLFCFIDSSKHPILSKRKSVVVNRNMAIFHLRQTIYGAFIKDIYEELYMFLKNTIFEAARNLKVNPDRLIGEHKVSLHAKEILQLADITLVTEKIIDILFQSLEAEQSTIKLIQKTKSKLGLTFSDSIIDAALPYLEVRHKLVHADGKLDAEFIRDYPQISHTNRNYVDIRFETITQALSTVGALVKAIDEDALQKGLVMPHITT